MITPETVASILRAANPRYAQGHHLNAHHPLISRCKLGTVFVDEHGNYCVYTGICGQNWKRPVMFTRVSDRATRKASQAYLVKIAKASVQDCA